MNIFNGHSGLATAIAIIAFAIVFQACSPSKVMRIDASWVMAGMQGEHLCIATGHRKYGQRKPVQSDEFGFSIFHPFTCAVSVFVFVPLPFDTGVFGRGVVNDFQPMQYAVGPNKPSFHGFSLCN